MIQSYMDLFGVVAPDHGDFGDQCNRTFSYHTLNILVGQNIPVAINKYRNALYKLEHPAYSGQYFRGLQRSGIPEKDWWADTRTTSRDQLSMVTCAHIAYRDKYSARRHFVAWMKRLFFAQNTHPNYEKPDNSKWKIPDFITPSLLSNMLRACEYKYTSWLIPILDLGLLVDQFISEHSSRWDKWVQHVPMVISANLCNDNIITRFCLKRLSQKRNEIVTSLDAYFASPFANCLPEFPELYIKAIERLHIAIGDLE